MLNMFIISFYKSIKLTLNYKMATLHPLHRNATFMKISSKHIRSRFTLGYLEPIYDITRELRILKSQKTSSEITVIETLYRYDREETHHVYRWAQFIIKVRLSSGGYAATSVRFTEVQIFMALECVPAAPQSQRPYLTWGWHHRAGHGPVT